MIETSTMHLNCCLSLVLKGKVALALQGARITPPSLGTSFVVVLAQKCSFT
jgi:hypothetical protein